MGVGVCFGNGCNNGHINDNPEIDVSGREAVRLDISSLLSGFSGFTGDLPQWIVLYCQLGLAAPLVREKSGCGANKMAKDAFAARCGAGRPVGSKGQPGEAHRPSSW
jgi:hypothetical protein